MVDFLLNLIAHNFLGISSQKSMIIRKCSHIYQNHFISYLEPQTLIFFIQSTRASLTLKSVIEFIGYNPYAHENNKVYLQHYIDMC